MYTYGSKTANTAPAATGIHYAKEFNNSHAELNAAVTTAGIATTAPGSPPGATTDTDPQQLAQAMARYASGGIMGQDSGAADAYVLATVGSFIMPKAYFKGMTVRFYPANSNATTTPTVNAFGLGAKRIYGPLGEAVSLGDIPASGLTELVYDPTLNGAVGGFKLAPWSIKKGKYCSLTGSITSVADTFVACANFALVSANLPNSTIAATGVTIGAGDEGVYVVSAGLQPAANSNKVCASILASGIGSWPNYDTSSGSTTIHISTVGSGYFPAGTVISFNGLLTGGSVSMNCALNVIRVGG